MAYRKTFSQTVEGSSLENITDIIRFEEVDSGSGLTIGIATLTREKPLNSLTLQTIDSLSAQITAWGVDENIACIVLNSSSDRAFCVGADIKALNRSCIEADHGANAYAEAFFTNEYALNYALHTIDKPMLVWGNGNVMGGGLGLLAGCTHRVGNPDTKLAMPEITIGLFPDAGGTYFLSRLPSRLGVFMGLTGCQITSGDALDIGLLDIVIAKDAKAEVLDGLKTLAWSGHSGNDRKLLTTYLDQFSVKENLPCHLMNHQEAIHSLIESCYASDNFFTAFRAGLKRFPDDPWLEQTVATFTGGSPTTAHIFLEQLKRAEGMSLADMYRLELVIAYQCTRHREFTEGVRALLIDKDRKPNWTHPSFSDVPKSWINEFFVPAWSGAHPLKDLGA